MSTARADPTVWASTPEGTPELSVIVSLDAVHPRSRHAIEAILEAVSGTGAEVILAAREPWVDAPRGVCVVAYDSAARGPRLDRAAEVARGEILAFVDDRVRLPDAWASNILAMFRDRSVEIAGGPVLPRSRRRSELVTAVIQNRLGLSPASPFARTGKPKAVREVAGSNLVVRARAFRAVGGFQSPSTGGEAVRLCYKIRHLLGERVLYEPALAVWATAQRFPWSFLETMAGYGRARGDLARRLPEAAPLVPYALPIIALVLVAAEVGLLPLRWWIAAKFGILFLAIAFLVEAITVLVGRERLSDRILASLCLPLVPLTYGVGFLRGFFGPSLGEISPRHARIPPLRVLIINWRDVTHPWAGGAEAYMHEMGRRWAAQGVDVGWLTQRHKGSMRVESVDGIRVHRVGGRFTQYALIPLVYLLRLRRRYDVIVDCENGIPYFSPLFSRAPRVLVVHHVHLEILRRELKPPLRWLAVWLEGWLVPRVYRRTQVVAVSRSTRDALVDIGFDPARISLVHNGVHPAPRLERCETAEPSILCAGRLKPQKTIDVLIRAVAEVRTTYPAIRLDVVGQGPDRTRLERLAWSLGLANNVRFHGYLPNRVRDEVASHAWVAACPSSMEGWGVVCMEASARRLPVVASDVAGLRDSVIDGQTGVLVPHGDPSLLAHALMRLFRDPALRAEMGDAGLVWSERHTWERSANEMLDVIHRLVPHRKARQTLSTATAAIVEVVHEELLTANAQ